VFTLLFLRYKVRHKKVAKLFTAIIAEAPGYSTTYSEGCSEVELGSEPVTCVITNDDNGPEQEVFTVSISTSGRGHGVVTIEEGGDGIRCDSDEEESDCTGEFPEGTVISLRATPDRGSNFNHSWSGACSGNNPTCQITVTGNTTVNANFSLNGGGGGGGGTVTPPTVVPPAPGPVPQVLGVTDEIPVSVPPAPVPEVLGAVDTLPVTGLPASAVLLTLTPFLWALRRKER